MQTANGARQNVIGFCTLPIHFKGVTKNIEFYLVPSLSQEAYFGINFWRQFALAPEIVPTISSIQLKSAIDSKNIHELSPKQKLIFEKTIFEFPSYEKLGLGCTELLEHHIDTGDACPIKCRHYPLSSPDKKEHIRKLTDF